jgi:hypothetical protein
MFHLVKQQITSIERKVLLVSEDGNNDAIAWHNLTENV